MGRSPNPCQENNSKHHTFFSQQIPTSRQQQQHHSSQNTKSRCLAEDRLRSLSHSVRTLEHTQLDSTPELNPNPTSNPQPPRLHVSCTRCTSTTALMTLPTIIMRTSYSRRKPTPTITFQLKLTHSGCFSITQIDSHSLLPRLP